jgi:hypothetical protein
VLQEGEIHSIVRRVALADDPSDFLRLPIDDVGRDQCQAAAGVLLFPEFAGFDSATTPNLPGTLYTRNRTVARLEQSDYALISGGAKPDSYSRATGRAAIRPERCNR